MTSVVGSVLSIDTFEEQFFVIKGMLQSPRLKDNVQTICIYQYKIIQQLMAKLFMLVNYLSNHNIFTPYNKTPIGIETITTATA